MSLWQWTLVFVGAGLVLVGAGIVLARAGDELAERTGWGRLFVGMLLVGLATSLPELVTGVSAAVAGAPSLAVGDLLGSSMANMAILGVVDLLARKRVWPRVELGQARLASVAMGLTALVGVAMLTRSGPTIGWVGWDSLVVAGVYVAAVAWVRRSPVTPRVPAAPLPVATGWAENRRGGRTRSRAGISLRFGAAAAVLLVAAPGLSVAAKEIASGTGAGETFVGTSLLAVVTSLPELVAAIAAVRIGASDLAVGNLFGSNAVNMALLVVVDAAYTSGPLLGDASRSEVVAALGAILLMAIALAAIVHGKETRVARLEPDAVLVLGAYVGCLFAVWAAR